MERHAAPLLALLLLGCGEGPQIYENPEDTAIREDETPPIITHEPVTSAQELGQSISLEATVTDDVDGDGEEDVDESGVFQVKIFFKQEITTVWDSTVMTQIDPSGIYGGSIPGTAVGSGGMDYYLWSVDRKQNESFLPRGGDNDAWHFRVTIDE
ncbi:MAG: hypothetical protein JXB39_05090 [Deltaproteobacteria bacterium]|nr:hypothetical protein [Deltaproteobacteria bacterium]